MPCNAGYDVRFRRVRYLTLSLAVMFFANNAAAAVCACIVDMAGQGHVAVHALGAKADEPACPQSGEAGPCLKHYLQSFQNGGQKIWAPVPATALVPVLNVLQVSVPARPKLVVVAAAPPIVGPPLAILYRNFRN